METAYPRLDTAQTHIWEADLDRSTGSDDFAILSDDEWMRAEKIRVPEARQRFTSCRRHLRTILAGYLGCDPVGVRFTYGRWGKPELVSAEPPLHFNVSHADGRALIAVTRSGSVGIDLERVRLLPEWESIAENFFSAEELERIQESEPERRPRAFMNSWTRREALLKRIGCGWSGEPRDLDVTAPSVQLVRTPDEYLGALALSEPASAVLHFSSQ